jgi:hypothetical protein
VRLAVAVVVERAWLIVHERREQRHGLPMGSGVHDHNPARNSPFTWRWAKPLVGRIVVDHDQREPVVTLDNAH